MSVETGAEGTNVELVEVGDIGQELSSSGPDPR